jgi:hypothetical protein
MTNKSAAATARRREMNEKEKHFLNEHTTIVLDEANDRLTIGFAHSCGQEKCPGAPQFTVLMRCPGGPCPP